MAHKIRKTFHKTREAAEAARDQATAFCPYSGTYSRGIRHCRIIIEGVEMDGFELELETYSG